MSPVYCGKIQRHMGSVLGPATGHAFEVDLFQSDEAKSSTEKSSPGKTGKTFELTSLILIGSKLELVL